MSERSLNRNGKPTKKQPAFAFLIPISNLGSHSVDLGDKNPLIRLTPSATGRWR